MESCLQNYIQESDTAGQKYHKKMEMNKEPASDDDIRFRPTIPLNSLPFLCCQLTKGREGMLGSHFWRIGLKCVLFCLEHRPKCRRFPELHIRTHKLNWESSWTPAPLIRILARLLISLCPAKFLFICQATDPCPTIYLSPGPALFVVPGWVVSILPLNRVCKNKTPTLGVENLSKYT